MAWDVLFYETNTGRTPIEDFLDGLSRPARQKCLSYIDLLAERGFTLKSQYIKKIEDDLWELRPEYGGTEYRFFYFSLVRGRLVIVHAFTKRTQRTPAREIETARRRIEDVRNRHRRGEFR